MLIERINKKSWKLIKSQGTEIKPLMFDIGKLPSQTYQKESIKTLT
jgi:hypothetical protein